MSGYAANERCVRISVVLEAADGCYVNFAKENVQVPPKSRFINKLVISRAILDADLVINVPKFKTHLPTRITGAVKNMFGILVGVEKARVHLSVPLPKDFSEALVDIYQVRVPDLTVLDAVVGMEGNGSSLIRQRPSAHWQGPALQEWGIHRWPDGLDDGSSSQKRGLSGYRFPEGAGRN